MTIHSYNIQSHSYVTESLSMFQERAGFFEKAYYYSGFQHLSLMKTVIKALQARVDQFESAKQPILSKKVSSLQDAKEQYQALYAKWPANFVGYPEIKDFFGVLTSNHKALTAAQGKLNCVIRKICQFVQMIFGCLRSRYENRLKDLKPKLFDGLKEHHPIDLFIGETKLKDQTPVSVFAQLRVDNNQYLQEGARITLWSPNVSKPIGEMLLTREEHVWDEVTVQEKFPEAGEILHQVTKEICILEQAPTNDIALPSNPILKGYKPGYFKLKSTSSTQ